MENRKLTLALMAGLPGTGKSTLARALGSDLDWHVIDKDGFKDGYLKEGMGDEKASRVAYKVSFDDAREKLIQYHTSAILDSAVLDSLTIVNAMDIIGSLKNVQLKVILCVTSREERLKRLRNRQTFSRTRLDPVTRADYLQIFTHLPSDRLELDTDDSLENCREKAREYLIADPAEVLISH